MKTRIKMYYLSFTHIYVEHQREWSMHQWKKISPHTGKIELVGGIKTESTASRKKGLGHRSDLDGRLMISSSKMVLLQGWRTTATTTTTGSCIIGGLPERQSTETPNLNFRHWWFLISNCHRCSDQFSGLPHLNLFVNFDSVAPEEEEYEY